MTVTVPTFFRFRSRHGRRRALLVAGLALSFGIGLALRLRPQRTLPAESIDSTVLPILQAAVAAGTAEETWRLLEDAGWAAIRLWHPDITNRTRFAPYRPGVHREVWETLLADDRIVGDPEYELRVFVKSADTLELLCDLGNTTDGCICGGDLHGAWGMPAYRRHRRTLERANALLDGTVQDDILLFAPPPTPAVAAANLARIASADIDDLPGFIRALTDSEYIAVMEDSETNRVVRSRLLAMARTVRQAPDPSIGLPIEVGKPLSVDMVSAAIVWLKTAALEGKTAQLSVMRRAAEDGLDICVNAPFPLVSNDTNRWPNCVVAEQPTVLGSVRQGADGMWPAATLSAEHLPPVEEDWDNIGFWIEVDRALTSEDASPFKDVTLFLLTR